MTEKQKQVMTAGLILAGLVLFVIGYFFFMNVRPGVAKAEAEQKAIQGRIATLDKEIKQMRAFVNNQEELERLRAQVEVARRRLPSGPEDYQFLQVLQDSLRKTGVAFTRLSRGGVVNRSLYSEIPYHVDGSARYHELGQFINLIECHPERFMRVSKIVVTNDYQRPSIHPIEIGISTFMFKSS